MTMTAIMMMMMTTTRRMTMTTKRTTMTTRVTQLWDLIEVRGFHEDIKDINNSDDDDDDDDHNDYNKEKKKNNNNGVGQFEHVRGSLHPSIHPYTSLHKKNNKTQSILHI